MTTRILIIEDEESIRLALEDDLAFEGYIVSTASDGPSGLSKGLERNSDLIILDIMLPGMDGFEVCRQLRQRGVGTPILMLTAKGQEIDKVLGLELGADDYVVKPFSQRELLARIKAILRRAQFARDKQDRKQFGNVEIDFKKFETTMDGKPVYLTALEYALIGFLIQHEGEVLDRSSILDEVWGEDVSVLPKTVDTHVGHLRRKLESDPAHPTHIISVHGAGYKFMP